MLLVSSLATGQEPPPPQRAQPVPQGAVPSGLAPLKVSGNTDGNAEFKAGGGLAIAINPDWDLSALASYRVKTTEGLSRLVATGDDGTEPAPWWQVAFSLSFARIGSVMSGSPVNRVQADQKVIAYAACENLCADADSTEAFCKLGKKLRHERRQSWAARNAIVFTDEAVCKGKRETVLKARQQFDLELSTCKNESCANLARDRFLAVKADLLVACTQECDAGRLRAPDPLFCGLEGLPMRPRPKDFSPDEFCDAGKKLWHENVEANARTSRFAPLMIDVGFRLGTEDFKYRAASDGGVLAKKKDTKVPWAAGVSAYALLDDVGSLLPYVEGKAVFERSWKKAEDEVEWCAPSGAVARTDDPGSPTDPAETCSKAALEGPQTQGDLQLAVFLGWFDNGTGDVRAGFGPEFVVPLASGDPRKAQVGAAVPITLGFANLVTPVEYKGLLRVTPRATWLMNDDEATEFRATVSLELLGQRSMFSEEFDEL
jgi:hypothetical protein